MPKLYVAQEHGTLPSTQAPPDLVHTRANSMDHVVDDEGFRLSSSTSKELLAPIACPFTHCLAPLLV